jgi:hypothetical protein
MMFTFLMLVSIALMIYGFFASPLARDCAAFVSKAFRPTIIETARSNSRERIARQTGASPARRAFGTR